MYQLRNKSNKRKRLTSQIVIYMLLFSLASANQERNDVESISWLALIEQGPMQAPAQIEQLDDLIQIVLTNNSRLQAQYAEWKMRLEQVGTIVRLPDPTFSAGYFLEPVETAQGPQAVKLSLGQTIPWFSKTKAAQQVKRAQADQAYEVLHNTKLHLIRELRLIWAETVYLQASKAILEKKVALSMDLEAILTAQYMSASISHRKYAGIQIQTLDLMEQLQKLKDREYRIHVDLAVILELDTPLGLPKINSVVISADYDSEVIDHHPKLLRLNKLYQEAKAQQLLAHADYVPDFRIGMDYILTDARIVNGLEVSGSGKNPLAFSFGISVPVWNWNKKRSAVEASKWQEKRVQSLQTEAAILLKQEYDTANSMLLESLRQIMLYENNLLPKAHEIVQVMEQAYISHSVDIDALTQARQKLLDLELRLADANRSAAVQNAILTYLRGEY